MLAVAATYMVFLRDVRRAVSAGQLAIPRIGLLLVSNEEPGEVEPWGTPFVLQELKTRYGYEPRIIIAGERTGEGATKQGTLELRNRGIIRFHVEAQGEAGHTAVKVGLSAIDKVMLLQQELRERMPALPMTANEDRFADRKLGNDRPPSHALVDPKGRAGQNESRNAQCPRPIRAPPPIPQQSVCPIPDRAPAQRMGDPSPSVRQRFPPRPESRG